MAIPDGLAKLTSGVSLGGIGGRFYHARRSRWRTVNITFGQTKFMECPECGALVGTPEGKLKHIERCDLAHYHDDMPDSDHEEAE